MFFLWLRGQQPVSGSRLGSRTERSNSNDLADHVTVTGSEENDFFLPAGQYTKYTELSLQTAFVSQMLWGLVQACRQSNQNLRQHATLNWQFSVVLFCFVTKYLFLQSELSLNCLSERLRVKWKNETSYLSRSWNLATPIRCTSHMISSKWIWVRCTATSPIFMIVFRRFLFIKWKLFCLEQRPKRSELMEEKRTCAGQSKVRQNVRRQPSWSFVFKYLSIFCINASVPTTHLIVLHLRENMPKQEGIFEFSNSLILSHQTKRTKQTATSCIFTQLHTVHLQENFPAHLVQKIIGWNCVQMFLKFSFVLVWVSPHGVQ